MSNDEIYSIHRRTHVNIFEALQEVHKQAINETQMAPRDIGLQGEGANGRPHPAVVQWLKRMEQESPKFEEIQKQLAADAKKNPDLLERIKRAIQKAYNWLMNKLKSMMESTEVLEEGVADLLKQASTMFFRLVGRIPAYVQTFVRWLFDLAIMPLRLLFKGWSAAENAFTPSEDIFNFVPAYLTFYMGQAVVASLLHTAGMATGLAVPIAIASSILIIAGVFLSYDARPLDPTRFFTAVKREYIRLATGDENKALDGVKDDWPQAGHDPISR